MTPEELVERVACPNHPGASLLIACSTCYDLILKDRETLLHNEDVILRQNRNLLDRFSAQNKEIVELHRRLDIAMKRLAETGSVGSHDPAA